MENEYEVKKNSREISRNIPDELLFEDILVRLPVKSLIAYKSVCKTWLYTIESCSFIEAHRRRHSCKYSADLIRFTPFISVPDPVAKSSYMLQYPPRIATDLMEMEHIPLEDLWLPLEMTRLNWPIVQLEEPDVEHASVRPGFWKVAIRALGPIKTTSIYCIVSYLHQVVFEWMRQDFLGAKIAICNPATRDYKLASPFPPEEIPQLLKLSAKQCCRAHYGFGVAADGDYKVVVVIICPPIYGSFLSYVYSLRQGAWKKIVDSENGMVSRLDLRDKQGFPYIYDNSLELCPQVFLNGCWHWVAVFKDESWNVLTFNVDSETFNLVRGPPSYRELLAAGMRTSSIVSVLNGHLVLLEHVAYLDDLDVDVISVWMMMEYGDEESWIKVWTVNLDCNEVKTLVGITYSLREDSNGGIQIERVLFQEYYNMGLISYDESGPVEQQLCLFDTSSCIFWNTLGISAYSETLDRLSPSKHGTAVA